MTVTRGWTQHYYTRWLEQTLTSLIHTHDETSSPAD